MPAAQAARTTRPRRPATTASRSVTRRSKYEGKEALGLCGIASIVGERVCERVFLSVNPDGEHHERGGGDGERPPTAEHQRSAEGDHRLAQVDRMAEEAVDTVGHERRPRA